MSDIYLDYGILDKLRLEYEKSHLSKKYKVDFDLVVAKANPKTGKHLEEFYSLFPLTRGQIRNIYRKFIAPALTEGKTPRLRRKLIRQVQKKLGEPIDRINDLAPNLQTVARYCSRENLEVRAIHKHLQSSWSATKLMIEGKLCGVYNRTKAIHYHGRPYLQFTIKSRVLRELDFVIVSWTDGDGKNQFYIIPADQLSVNKANTEPRVFNIPLNKIGNAGRKSLLDWSKYQNAWKQLKTAA